MKMQCLVRFVVVAFIGTGHSWANEEFHVCRYHEHTVESTFAAGDKTSPRQYAPHRDVDVLHIRIDVLPILTSETVAGTTRIEFTPIAKPLEALRLDAVRLSVAAVRSSAAVDDFVVTESDVTSPLCSQPIAVGERAFVEIDYSAQPRKGFYFRTAKMGYDAGDTQVWTQGEPHEARHWFPCVDYPNEKSTTEVICHIPGRHDGVVQRPA